MINQDKWIDSLPKNNKTLNEKGNQLNHDKWINTIPKINKYNFIKKYTLLTIFFISGLLCVSAIKNETRNLQKEINNLTVSIDLIKYNLDQAILDHAVITSPDNISQLANEYLDTNFQSYRRSQIRKLNDNQGINKAIIKREDNRKKIENFSTNVKSKVTKKIEETRVEMNKLKELYKNPELIPEEVKKQTVKKVEEKKSTLKNAYQNPQDIFTAEKITRWGTLQVVKVFFGIPIVPGR